MTIAQTAARTAATLRAEAPKAHTRTIDASDIEHAIKAHLKQARAAKRRDAGEVVRTTLRGGYVPNSYGYSADADRVTITGTTATALTIEARRERAQSRPSGSGSLLIIRCIKPGQTRGRIVA